MVNDDDDDDDACVCTRALNVHFLFCFFSCEASVTVAARGYNS